MSESDNETKLNNRREHDGFARSAFVQSNENNRHVRALSETQKKPNADEDPNKSKFIKKWIEKAVPFSLNPDRSLELDQLVIKQTLIDVWMGERFRFYIPGHPKTALVSSGKVLLNELTPTSPPPLAVRSEKLENAQNLRSEEINFDLSKIDDITNLSGISLHCMLTADSDVRPQDNLLISNNKIYNVDHDKKKANALTEVLDANGPVTVERLKIFHARQCYNYGIDTQTLQALPNLVSANPFQTYTNHLPAPETFAPAWWLSDIGGDKDSDRTVTTDILSLTVAQREQLKKQKLHDFLKVIATPEELDEKIYWNALGYEQISDITAKYCQADGTYLERPVLTKEEFEEFRYRLYKDDCERRQVFIREAFKWPEFVEFYNQEINKFDQKLPSAFDDIASDFLHFQKHSKSGGKYIYSFGSGNAIDSETNLTVEGSDLTKFLLTMFAGEAKLQYDRCFHKHEEYLECVKSWVNDNKRLGWFTRNRYNKLINKLTAQVKSIYPQSSPDVYDDYKILYVFASMIYQFSKDNKSTKVLSSKASALHYGVFNKTQAIIEDNFYLLAKAKIKNSARNKLLLKFGEILQANFNQLGQVDIELAAKMQVDFRNAWLEIGYQQVGHPILQYLQQELNKLNHSPEAQNYLLYCVYRAAESYEKNSPLMHYLHNALGANLDNFDKINKKNSEAMIYSFYQLIKQQDSFRYKFITFINHYLGWFTNRRKEINEAVDEMWKVASILVNERSKDPKVITIDEFIEVIPEKVKTPVIRDSFMYAHEILQGADKSADNTKAEISGKGKGNLSSSDDEKPQDTAKIATVPNRNEMFNEAVSDEELDDKVENKPKIVEKIQSKSTSLLSVGLKTFGKANPRVYPHFVRYLCDFLDTNDDQKTKEYMLWIAYEAACKKGGSEADMLAKFLRRILMLQITNNAVEVIESSTSKRDKKIKNHFSCRKDIRLIEVQDTTDCLRVQSKYNDKYNYNVDTKQATVDQIVALFTLELKKKTTSIESVYSENWKKVDTYVKHRKCEAYAVEHLMPENQVLYNADLLMYEVEAQLKASMVPALTKGGGIN